MANPYTPPGSPLKDPPELQRRSTVGAVVIGFFVDVVGTMIFSFVAASVFAMLLGSADAAPETLAADIQQSTGFQFVGMAGGLACTVLGAYMAARFANHAEYATAFAVGVASLVFGEATLLTLPNDVPMWQRLMGDLLVIPAALIGGHLRVLQKQPAVRSK
jgi:hypothetical protein